MSAISDTEFIRLFGKITPEDKTQIKDIIEGALPKRLPPGRTAKQEIEDLSEKVFSRILKAIKSNLAKEARRQLKEDPRVRDLLDKGRFPKEIQQKSIVEILRKDFKTGNKKLDEAIKQKAFVMGKVRRQVEGQKIVEVPLQNYTYLQTNSISLRDSPQTQKPFFPYIYDYTMENEDGEVGQNIYPYPFPPPFQYFKNTGLDYDIHAEYKRIFNKPSTLKANWNTDPYLSPHLGRAKIIITPGGNLGLEQTIGGKTYNLITIMPYTISNFMACLVWGGAESVCNMFFVEGILYFHFHTKKNSAIVNNYPALATPQTVFIPVQQTLQVPSLGRMVSKDLLLCFDYTSKNNLGKIPVFTSDTKISLITKQQTQEDFKLSEDLLNEVKLKATLGNVYLTKEDLNRGIGKNNVDLLRVGFAVNVFKYQSTDTQRYFIFH